MDSTASGSLLLSPISGIAQDQFFTPAGNSPAVRGRENPPLPQASQVALTPATEEFSPEETSKLLYVVSVAIRVVKAVVNFFVYLASFLYGVVTYPFRASSISQDNMPEGSNLEIPTNLSLSSLSGWPRNERVVSQVIQTPLGTALKDFIVQGPNLMIQDLIESQKTSDTLSDLEKIFPPALSSSSSKEYRKFRDLIDCELLTKVVEEIIPRVLHKLDFFLRSLTPSTRDPIPLSEERFTALFTHVMKEMERYLVTQSVSTIVIYEDGQEEGQLIEKALLELLLKLLEDHNVQGEPSLRDLETQVIESLLGYLERYSLSFREVLGIISSISEERGFNGLEKILVKGGLRWVLEKITRLISQFAEREKIAQLLEEEILPLIHKKIVEDVPSTAVSHRVGCRIAYDFKGFFQKIFDAAGFQGWFVTPLIERVLLPKFAPTSLSLNLDDLFEPLVTKLQDRQFIISVFQNVAGPKQQVKPREGVLNAMIKDIFEKYLNFTGASIATRFTGNQESVKQNFNRLVNGVLLNEQRTKKFVVNVVKIITSIVDQHPLSRAPEPVNRRLCFDNN